MGEIVNLRRARKTRQRAEAAAEAQTNRALHGRTTAERDRQRLDREQQDRALDGARLSEKPT